MRNAEKARANLGQLVEGFEDEDGGYQSGEDLLREARNEPDQERTLEHRDHQADDSDPDPDPDPDRHER